MAETRFRIEHPDGRAYDVSATAFSRTFEREGFRKVAKADGTALDEPKPARSSKPASRDRSAAAKKGAATKAARRVAEAIAIDSGSGEGATS